MAPWASMAATPWPNLDQNMAAICLAINERESALGVAPASETKFTTDSGYISRPSAGDFRGMLYSSELSTPMEEAAAWIQSACSSFIVSATSDTFWTSSTLIASVGLGNFPVSATWRLDNDWLRLQQCLDKLIYSKDTFGATWTPGGHTFKSSVDWGKYPQGTWVHLQTDPDTNGSGSAGISNIRWQDNGSSGGAWVDDNSSFVVDTTSYPVGSTTSKSEALYGHSSNATITVRATVTGGSITLGSGSNPATKTTSMDVGVLNPVTMAFITSEPATSPFVLPVGGLAVCNFSSNTIWFDISPLLSDK